MTGVQGRGADLSSAESDHIGSRDGTALCLACGFCCDGTLHTNTVIQPDEVSAVTDLGLTVEIAQDKPAFRQPCVMFRDGSCSIYDRRPHVCWRYECALLRRHLAGEIALEQALRVVNTAHTQLGVFRNRTPDAISFMRWLKLLEAGEDSEAAQSLLSDAGASNHTVALVVYLTKYFGDNTGEA